MILFISNQIALEHFSLFLDKQTKMHREFDFFYLFQSIFAEGFVKKILIINY